MITPGRPDHKLGILFVHGIGEQREGDTLTSFGEPLIGWLRDWIRGQGELSFREPVSKKNQERLDQLGCRADGVEMITAELFPSLRQSTDPPHTVADIRMTHGKDSEQSRQSWLLAECWWGEQVQPPPVFTLLGWMFSRGPWIALAHFAERAWRFSRRAPLPVDASRAQRVGRVIASWKTAAWLPAALLFLLSSISLQLFLLISAVVALIPIPSVRRYVSAVLQRATSILGDSYGLVANETQRAAILTRFSETVRWLEPRSEKTVIIAHSQGAAVVGAAIDEGLIKPPDLLITFGAGLVKLLQLRQCEVCRRGLLLATGWIVPSLLAAILLHVFMAFGADQDYSGLWLVTIALYLSAAFCTIAATIAWTETRVQTGTAREERGRWIDLYASSDPVPQDRLDVHLPNHEVVSSRIISRRSMLSDHTSYWQNRPEFVTRVAAELDKEAQLLRIPELDSSKEYKRAVKHHRDAMTVLSIGWGSFMVSLAAWALFQFNRLSATGQDLLEAADGTPLSLIAGPIVSAGNLIQWIVLQLTDSTPRILEPLGHATVALGVGALTGYLWWKAVVVVFTKWNSASLDDFLTSGRTAFWGRYGTLIVWPFMDLLALMPLAVAFCLWVEASPWIFVLRAAGWIILIIYSILFGFILLAKIPKNWKAAQDLYARSRAYLVRMTQPGSDTDDTQASNWGELASACVGLIAVCLVASFGLEKLDLKSASFVSGNAVFVGMALFFVLLLVRLSRLVQQRGYPAMAGTLAGLLIPGAIAWLASQERMNAGLTYELVALIISVSLIPLGLVYFATDRWLPRRVPQNMGSDPISRMKNHPRVPD
jgi:hypothetical protein